MLEFIFGLIFFIVAVSLVAVYQAYASLPIAELKRRASRGDEVAYLLHRTAAYGANARLLLAILTLLFISLAIVMFDSAIANELVRLALVVVCLSTLVLVYLQDGNMKLGTKLATKLSPAIVWALERVHPMIDAVTRRASRVIKNFQHTGMFEREDLLRALDKQHSQPDNRINKDDLEIVKNVLEFGDKHVADVHIPKRVVQSVGVHETVGPVLMGELHDGGHSRFPVHDGANKDAVMGVLYLKDMITEKQGASVEAVMRKQVAYVHEDATLRQALQAFLKTRQQLAIVVNEFEEYVGIVTLEDVLEQIIGKPIVDEFDEYEDLRAVATRMAQKEHKVHAKQELTPETAE